MKCGDCRYCEIHEFRTQGYEDKNFYCLRYPPQVVPYGVKLTLTYRFPKVEEDDWCGEFKAEVNEMP